MGVEKKHSEFAGVIGSVLIAGLFIGYLSNSVPEIPDTAVPTSFDFEPDQPTLFPEAAAKENIDGPLRDFLEQEMAVSREDVASMFQPHEAEALKAYVKEYTAWAQNVAEEYKWVGGIDWNRDMTEISADTFTEKMAKEQYMNMQAALGRISETGWQMEGARSEAHPLFRYARAIGNMTDMNMAGENIGAYQAHQQALEGLKRLNADLKIIEDAADTLNELKEKGAFLSFTDVGGYAPRDINSFSGVDFKDGAHSDVPRRTAAAMVVLDRDLQEAFNGDENYKVFVTEGYGLTHPHQSDAHKFGYAFDFRFENVNLIKSEENVAKVMYEAYQSPYYDIRFEPKGFALSVDRVIDLMAERLASDERIPLEDARAEIFSYLKGDFGSKTPFWKWWGNGIFTNGAHFHVEVSGGKTPDVDFTYPRFAPAKPADPLVS